MTGEWEGGDGRMGRRCRENGKAVTGEWEGGDGKWEGGDGIMGRR